MASIVELKAGDLLVIKLGASAVDLATDDPWIPTEKEIDDTKKIWEGALGQAKIDATVLVVHFAQEISDVVKGKICTKI